MRTRKETKRSPVDECDHNECDHVCELKRKRRPYHGFTQKEADQIDHLLQLDADNMKPKKFTHTPGQWIVDGNGFSPSWNVSGDVSICDVTTSRADAQLIASAPELLSALIQAIESCGGQDEFYHATKALIAKATGGVS